MHQNLNIYDVLETWFEYTVLMLAEEIDLFGCLKSERRSGQQRFFLFSGRRAVAGEGGGKGTNGACEAFTRERGGWKWRSQ